MRILSTSIARLFLAFVLALSNQSFAQTLEPIDFARLPDVQQLSLSPDGKHIVYLARVNAGKYKGLAVTILDLDTYTPEIIAYSNNETFMVTRVSWANNENLLVHARMPKVRYGTPVVETRLLIANIKTKKIESAISRKQYRKFSHFPQFQDNIIDSMPFDSDHYLLQIDRQSPNEPGVYRMSISKGYMKPIQGSKKNIVRWTTDQQQRVRLGLYFKDTHYKIIHRAPEQKKWQTLWEFDTFSVNQVWPLGFTENSNELYVQALHEGREAIFLVDLQDPELKKKLIYSDKNYDIDGRLFYSPKTGKAVGLFTNERYIFWDKSYNALVKGINKGLPDTNNYFTSFSQNERRYLIFSTSDSDPGTYYLGDRDQKSLSPIARRYNKLTPELMTEKQHISYKARDGLEIEGYLSLPKYHREGMKHPTIIFPHGGPISHDDSGFDYWTQFFTNSGYAVLQMNFRGSSGYGHDFMKAGLKSWGLSMQDDVEDGTRWMIEKGYSEANNICIVGASYGGYAALMGTVKTPDLYKCAVSFAGVTDISYLVKSQRRFTNYESVKEQIGDNHKELKQRSPLHNAQEIQTPVLLIHGTKDRVVKVQHSKRMAKKLQKYDKNVKYVELKDGNHYLSNGERRIKTFTEMDTFLKQHLKVKK